MAGAGPWSPPPAWPPSSARIARMLEEVEHEETPLERRMTTIGRVLAVICLSVAVGAVAPGALPRERAAGR